MDFFRMVALVIGIIIVVATVWYALAEVGWI
jgi:hypothetical protein